MTLWQYYIHRGVYDVCVTKFQMLDLLILTRNKDLLDVLWGHPRQRILNCTPSDVLTLNAILNLSCFKPWSSHFFFTKLTRRVGVSIAFLEIVSKNSTSLNRHFRDLNWLNTWTLTKLVWLLHDRTCGIRKSRNILILCF